MEQTLEALETCQLGLGMFHLYIICENTFLVGDP